MDFNTFLIGAFHHYNDLHFLFVILLLLLTSPYAIWKAWKITSISIIAVAEGKAQPANISM